MSTNEFVMKRVIFAGKNLSHVKVSVEGNQKVQLWEGASWSRKDG